MMRAGLVLIQGGFGAAFLATIGLAAGSRVPSGHSFMPAMGVLLICLGMLPCLAGVVLWGRWMDRRGLCHPS